jgi:hypothetical protein
MLIDYYISVVVVKMDRVYFRESGGRARRFSASFTPVGGGGSPKLTPRVNQLRREESSLDSLIGREAAHEKELHSAILISQSWEDLTLVNDNKVLPPLHLVIISVLLKKIKNTNLN